MNANDLWVRYSKIWTAPVEVRSRELAACLADNATYCDPNGLIQGATALSDYMGRFQQHISDAEFHTAQFAQHHDRVLAHWQLVSNKGEILQSGISFAQLADDGRLQAITGFFQQFFALLYLRDLMSRESDRARAQEVADRLRLTGDVSITPFFGGAGIRIAGVQFAFVIKGTVYFRVDKTTMLDYQALGAHPFSYATRARTVSVSSYFNVPDDIIDDDAKLRKWALRAHKIAAG